MKDADKMAKLLEAAKIVLEEDIIPSLPSRKRLSALLVEEALSIALNTTYQLVRQEENETAKNNKLLSNQIRTGVYDTSLDGEITKILSQDVSERLEASTPDFKIHQKFSQYLTCLLYTSPSPRDVEESRMPSSA